MSTNILDLQNRTNIFIRDTTTASISSTDRLVAYSIAVQDILVEFGFDHENVTYNLSFLDTVDSYRLNVDITDVIEPVDLRRAEGKNDELFTRKNARELSQEISGGAEDNAFAI